MIRLNISPFLRIVKKYMYNYMLEGYIDGRDGDTLFISFKEIINDTNVIIKRIKQEVPQDSNNVKKINYYYSNYINSNNVVNKDSNNFCYIIKWKNMKHFSIPFKARVFSANVTPFTYNFKSPYQLQTNLINFSTAFYFIRGKTIIYKNDRRNDKHLSWGIGPSLGITEKDKNDNSYYGITGGVSIFGSPIENFFFIVTAGYNKGFYINNINSSPFISFGLGFKIIDFSKDKLNNLDRNIGLGIIFSNCI